MTAKSKAASLGALTITAENQWEHEALLEFQLLYRSNMSGVTPFEDFVTSLMGLYCAGKTTPNDVRPYLKEFEANFECVSETVRSAAEVQAILNQHYPRHNGNGNGNHSRGKKA
jgi:hypothetical protein